MAQASQKLSNLQLELLRLYTRPISEDDLMVIRTFLSDYFAKKAIQEANRVWDEQNWNEDKVQKLLNSHLRTPYKQP
jgi:hypothetical protein